MSGEKVLVLQEEVWAHRPKEREHTCRATWGSARTGQGTEGVGTPGRGRVGTCVDVGLAV